MTDALTPISIMNISDFLIAQAEEQVRNAGLRIADQQAVVESLACLIHDGDGNGAAEVA
jgi:hypothetical protein